MGAPYADTWPKLHKFFGITTQAELRLKLGDEYFFLPTEGGLGRTGDFPFHTTPGDTGLFLNAGIYIATISSTVMEAISGAD